MYYQLIHVSTLQLLLATNVFSMYVLDYATTLVKHLLSAITPFISINTHSHS